MIETVNIPCYCGLDGQCHIHRLTVKEFAGKVVLEIRSEPGCVDTPVILKVEFQKDDLDRAWNAVRQF